MSTICGSSLEYPTYTCVVTSNWKGGCLVPCEWGDGLREARLARGTPPSTGEQQKRANMTITQETERLARVLRDRGALNRSTPGSWDFSCQSCRPGNLNGVATFVDRYEKDPNLSVLLVVCNGRSNHQPIDMGFEWDDLYFPRGSISELPSFPRPTKATKAERVAAFIDYYVEDGPKFQHDVMQQLGLLGFKRKTIYRGLELSSAISVPVYGQNRKLANVWITESQLAVALDGKKSINTHTSPSLQSGDLEKCPSPLRKTYFPISPYTTPYGVGEAVSENGVHQPSTGIQPRQGAGLMPSPLSSSSPESSEESSVMAKELVAAGYAAPRDGSQL